MVGATRCIQMQQVLSIFTTQSMHEAGVGVIVDGGIKPLIFLDKWIPLKKLSVNK